MASPSAGTQHGNETRYGWRKERETYFTEFLSSLTSHTWSAAARPSIRSQLFEGMLQTKRFLRIQMHCFTKYLSSVYFFGVVCQMPYISPISCSTRCQQDKFLSQTVFPLISSCVHTALESYAARSTAAFGVEFLSYIKAHSVDDSNI